MRLASFRVRNNGAPAAMNVASRDHPFTNVNMSTNNLPPVYPPPIILPPPVLPAAYSPCSSSSGRKRKLHNITCNSYAGSSACSEFSSAVKGRAELITDSETCWHCGARPTDICHVIGKKDREVDAF
jgi:hypothetical protein